MSLYQEAKKSNCYLSLPSIVCAAGGEDILPRLTQSKRFLKKRTFLDREFLVGEVEDILQSSDFPPSLEAFYTRGNALLLQAILKISPLVEGLKNKFGKHRIGVCIGTTTGGIEENFQSFLESQDFKSAYRPNLNSLGYPAKFVQRFFGLKGPSFGVSTACTSGLKALIQAQRLIARNLCDAVIVGGVDSLSTISLFGFDSLGILSPKACNPFSKNRDGINIGEGACVFIASKEPLDSSVILESFGSNNDAFHLTKQDTHAKKAIEAIELARQNMPVDYVNLHATGTPANEIAESLAIFSTLPDIFASGIKGHIGHTLGAAGAIEAGVCILLLHQKETLLPLHLYDGEYDSSLHPIKLVSQPTCASLNRIMSVNFAFGGDNAVAIFGRKE